MLIFCDKDIFIEHEILNSGASQYRIVATKLYTDNYQQTYQIKLYLAIIVMMYRFYKGIIIFIALLIVIIIYILRMYVLTEEKILVVPSIGMQINRRYSDKWETVTFIPFGIGSIPHIIEVIKRFRVIYVGVIAINGDKKKLTRLSHFPLSFPALRAILLSINNIIDNSKNIKSI